MDGEPTFISFSEMILENCSLKNWEKCINSDPPLTVKQSIIKLISKPRKDETIIDNLRSITLEYIRKSLFMHWPLDLRLV